MSFSLSLSLRAGQGRFVCVNWRSNNEFHSSLFKFSSSFLFSFSVSPCSHRFALYIFPSVTLQPTLRTRSPFHSYVWLMVVGQTRNKNTTRPLCARVLLLLLLSFVAPRRRQGNSRSLCCCQLEWDVWNQIVWQALTPTPVTSRTTLANTLAPHRHHVGSFSFLLLFFLFPWRPIGELPLDESCTSQASGTKPHISSISPFFNDRLFSLFLCWIKAEAKLPNSAERSVVVVVLLSLWIIDALAYFLKFEEQLVERHNSPKAIHTYCCK